MEVIGPLHWVIDALDESESVNTIIGTLSSISASRTPIRVIVLSRQIPAITRAFDRASTTIPVTALCGDHNAEDIRLYAASEMDYMHGNAEFRLEIVNEIAERAQGNFLWVHLALKEILLCHTQGGIKETLEEIPSGMSSLYQRMEAAIGTLARTSDKILAKMILTWATYSRRSLDAEELICALRPEYPAVIDLRHTIDQVCGHFVIVDSNNQIHLVHQTAREYLAKASNLPFSFNAQTAQEELFVKTISVYLDPHVRTKLSQQPLPPFYAYAATSWGYHLNGSSAGSDNALSSLVKFFQGPYVLPWIQALATLKDLKFLVFASQSLTTLIRKRRNIDASRMPLLHRLSDLDLLEHWATDLLKVVGKFGGHLLQDPTTIYRFIPQFCPHNSILYRQFGKALSSPLSVTGLSNRDWDDCLARVSVGSEHQALMVTCSGRYLAVLTSARTIVLWDSRTFEEFRTLSHREHIFAMCFSASGGELASYGFLTTRIWSVSSGRQLHKVANPTDRALCLAFAENDTVLLMGSDLRRVKKLSLDDTLEGWQALNSSLLQEDSSLEGTFLNSPTALAFNSDTTQIAVAYRGFPLTVWALTSPRLINRCKRRLGHNTNPMNAWTGVNRVLWHPHSGEVLGIYTDGIVFKWHPLEESHHELKADLHATPSEVQCSPDGHVFGTSDVHGTVKLYNFHHFTLIYQLSSENIVTALCFSPDSKRFYDLRGSYCNAWEPNVLIRLSDTDEGANEIDTEERSVTISYQASEVWAETPVPITALSAQWQGSLLCAGNDEGVVEMYDIANGTKLGVGKSATEFTIDYLTWGEDGKHFAYAEIGGKLAVKCIEAQAGGQNKVPWGYRSVMSVKLNLEAGRIHQLLLSPGSDFLLVVSLNGAQLWSLQTQSIKAIYTSTEPGVLQKWASHPSNRGQVLAFTPSMVTACSWDSLQKVGQWKIKLPPGHMLDEVEEERPVLSSISSLQDPMSTLGNNEIIDEVIVPQAEGYILLHISGHGQHRRARSQLRIIDVASLRETAAGGSATLEPIPVPADVAAAIERPLNVLGRDRLVFLDRSFWICTWRLRHAGGPGGWTRHFFLPRDWVNAGSLKLCQVMADGTFICPRNGEVAVIKSGLGSGW